MQAVCCLFAMSTNIVKIVKNALRKQCMKIWFINSFNDKYINYHEKLLMSFILFRTMTKIAWKIF